MRDSPVDDFETKEGEYVSGFKCRKVSMRRKSVIKFRIGESTGSSPFPDRESRLESRALRSDPIK